MSVAGRNRVREDRFYSPPAMRRFNQQQQRQQQQQLVQQVQQQQQQQQQVQQKQEEELSHLQTVSLKVMSSTGSSSLTNLDRFLEHTTPIVSAQHFSKTSMKGWRIRDDSFHPYFILGDLWESFKEWSAYGAGVPLVLNGSDSVVQYYVPYLSGIQLYVDPSTPFTRVRRPGEDSDAESSRATSSEGSSECGADIGANGVERAWIPKNTGNATAQSYNRQSLKENSFMDSANDESEVSNPPGLLIFEYFEHVPPFNREPLADKISVLVSQFPELKTCKSCDLTPASWISVAWYPIYRIPVGPSLQNLDACFLTFHSLSTPFGSTSSEWPHVHGSTVREVHNAGMPFRLLLPIFGLAAYKFKVSDWNQSGAHGCQKVNSLLRAADNWLRLLHVNHPDYGFFLSHSSYWR